jgi:cytochrome c-type biogenesis protein
MRPLRWRTPAILAAVALAIGVAIAVRYQHRQTVPDAPRPELRAPAAEAALPRLVELGSHECVPCKLMAPVLAELRAGYAGQLQVDAIDVWQDPDAGKQFGVEIIPTQVFLDAHGKEVFRHQGFIGKEDIVAKWNELGIVLGPPAADSRDADNASPRPAASAPATLFAWLTHAVEGSAALALGAAFIWGVLSILLSPCHLASIPLIVGFVDLQGRISTRRAFAISSLFAVGILGTIALIGLLTAGAGRMAGDLGRGGNFFVAAIFVAVGLYLLEVLPLPWSGPGQVGLKRKGLLAAFILGLVFGIALGPCTFAYMAPLLGVTFKVAQTQMAYGALLLLLYGVGHCSVIVCAGTFTEVVQRYLNWSEKSRGSLVLKRACGALVILGGMYLIYTAP